MQWLSDQELAALDDVLRAPTGSGDSPAFVTTLEGIAALCRAYPRVVQELRTLRNEASRLRQATAHAAADKRRLESELAAANAKIAGLEKLHAA
jgi:hypothetical protein